MIAIARQNEPANFDRLVRQPGSKFLATVPNPTDAQWTKKSYWQRALPDMRNAYNKICAYCACWIPHSTGSHSIDHFTAKKINPQLAYEWNNFRYVSSRFNSRKGIKAIVDPLAMIVQWFVIDFTTFLIKPNKAVLTAEELKLANDTISILKLNDDEDLVNERQVYFQDYKTGEITFDYLKRQAPFIATEIERQNLLN